MRGKRFVVHVKIITGEWISNWLTEIIAALASGQSNASTCFRSPLNDWIVYIKTKTKKLLQKTLSKKIKKVELKLGRGRLNMGDNPV